MMTESKSDTSLLHVPSASPLTTPSRSASPSKGFFDRLHTRLKSTSSSASSFVLDNHTEWDRILETTYAVGEALDIAPLKGAVQITRVILNIAKEVDDNRERITTILNLVLRHLQVLSDTLCGDAELASRISSHPTFMRHVTAFQDVLRDSCTRLEGVAADNHFWRQTKINAELDQVERNIQDATTVFQTQAGLSAAAYSVVTFHEVKGNATGSPPAFRDTRLSPVNGTQTTSVVTPPTTLEARTPKVGEKTPCYLYNKRQQEQMLDVSGRDFRSIIGYTYHGGHNQQWTLVTTTQGTAVRSGNGGWLGAPRIAAHAQLAMVDEMFFWEVAWSLDRKAIQLLVPGTMLCVDLEASSPEPSTKVILYTNLGTQNQWWCLREREAW